MTEVLFMDLIEAIKQRKSIRAFSKKQVPLELIEEIIGISLNAPSAINLQPWDFYIVYGEEKKRLSRALLKAYKEKKISCGPGTEKPLPPVYNRRGVEVTESMQPFLDELGIFFNQFINEGSSNFYGAPVAVFICIDSCFPKMRLLDIGIILSHFLLTAYDYGMATCPIGLLLAYENEVKEFLDIPDDKSVAIAVALGYADGDNPINKYKSSRDSKEKFIHWIG
jgi:nitroreductase